MLFLNKSKGLRGEKVFLLINTSLFYADASRGRFGCRRVWRRQCLWVVAATSLTLQPVALADSVSHNLNGIYQSALLYINVNSISECTLFMEEKNYCVRIKRIPKQSQEVWLNWLRHCRNPVQPYHHHLRLAPKKLNCSLQEVFGGIEASSYVSTQCLEKCCPLRCLRFWRQCRRILREKHPTVLHACFTAPTMRKTVACSLCKN